MPDSYAWIVYAAAGIAAAISVIVLGRRRIDCPKCGARQPTFRKPRSFRQAMLGGFTCANCGQEMDRRGKARG